MDKLKILVVCSRNKKRSLTAEKIYKNNQRFEVRSAGTSPSARRVIRKADIVWSKLIICMENKHLKMIEQLFEKNSLPDVLVLNIEDKYELMEPELIEMLRDEIELLVN